MFDKDGLHKPVFLDTATYYLKLKKKQKTKHLVVFTTDDYTPDVL